MNSTAKWTTYSFLAVAGLAAGMLAVGCTVTSGTVDDPNGGDGTDTSDADSGSTSNNDAGTDANANDAAAPVCAGNQQEGAIVSAECQSCLENNCCSQLTGCFNLDPGSDGDGGKNATCAEYADFYGDCEAQCDTDNPSDDAAFDKCVTDVCKAASGNPAIADAWEAVMNCAATSCEATCFQ